jgi:glucose/arabinose dehydrogenase
MKRLSPKPILAVALCVAFTLFLVSMAQLGAAQQALQAPAAAQTPPTPGAPAAPDGARGGRGGARGPAFVLGDGPWDVTAGGVKMHITVVTKGLDHPWGMAFLPDGSMLVTERAGRLRVIRNGVLAATPIAGLPKIRAVSLNGLHDIAIHPNFASNRYIYMVYAKPAEDDATRSTLAVMRAKWDGKELSDVKDIFLAQPYYGGRGTPTPDRCCGQGPLDASLGSRLAFDKAGYLYVTVGDRNYGEMAQDPSSDIGKILRLKDDGTIPQDNPFVGKEGYRPEIYTIGHRNPLGLTIHPQTGDLWESEFGPRGGDEVNRIQKGKNYGWILITNGAHYNGEATKLGANSVPGYEDPVLHWEPSINPGNLLFYNGKKFPEWEGAMLMAAMSKSLLLAKFDSQGKVLSQERMLATEINQRLRDVRQGPDGFIYVATDETAGTILKIEPGK